MTSIVVSHDPTASFDRRSHCPDLSRSRSCSERPTSFATEDPVVRQFVSGSSVGPMETPGFLSAREGVTRTRSKKTLRLFRLKMAAACQRACRSLDDDADRGVQAQPSGLIEQARIRPRATSLAKNYAQELRDKGGVCAPARLRWHAIGPLQSNSRKYVAGSRSRFNALCSLDIAIELGKRRSEPPIDADRGRPSRAKTDKSRNRTIKAGVAGG